MSDIVLDTHVLGELLRQYWSADSRTHFVVVENGFLTKSVAHAVNSIIKSHFLGTPHGLVVASVMAFVELARKFEEIVGEGVGVFRLEAFINNMPDWFTVEPIDFPLLHCFLNLPGLVFLDNRSENIEAIDNYHVATAMVRSSAKLATCDQKLIAAYTEIIVGSERT